MYLASRYHLAAAFAVGLSAAFSTGAQNTPDAEHRWFESNPTLPPSLDVGAIADLPGTRHQGVLRGVNSSFDWAATSVSHGGHVPPAGYKALTGWGQATWRADWSPTPGQALEIKDSATLICHQGGNTGVRWTRLPVRGITGAAFDPNYAGNASVQATIEPIDGGQRVQFSDDRAFHFYPTDRATLDPAATSSVCGVLYVFRARAVLANGQLLGPGQTPALLIGAGADYWPTNTSPYPGNVGIGAGQMRAVSGKWRWYGFTSAPWSALNALDRDGFQRLN